MELSKPELADAADGEMVIVDRSQRLQDSLGERISVVFGSMGMIKRLRPMPDGTVKIMSDNQSVRDDIATDGDLDAQSREQPVLSYRELTSQRTRSCSIVVGRQRSSFHPRASYRQPSYLKNLED